MYKYNQSEFESMMDELMHDFKKGCGKSEAELDVAYKILNPSPVGGFVDSLVKMDKDYSTNLWEIKRKQIKSFIPECDGYQLDDIVAYCRAKFFKEEVDRIIYDNSIAEECDVCVYADGTILSPEWPYLCAKVYVSIKWIDENKTTYTRIFPSAVGFMSYKTKGSMEDDLKQKENMSTMEMREHLKISRAEFSRRYNIPIRTLESWESEVRTPPEYVLQLLEESVRRTDIVEVTFMYDTLLQEGKIHPLFKDLDDQYGADQAAYKTVLNIVDRFRERYPNCEWEDEDVDYIDAIEGFATNLLMATLGKGEANE